MDFGKFYNSLLVFFSDWFRDIKKHVFKVEITNGDKGGIGILEKRMEAVVSSLDLVGKQLERSSSAQSTEYLKSLGAKISALIVLLKNTKELNISSLERSVNDLVRAVKRTEVTGKVSVANFPDVQKVSGKVDIDLKTVVDGIQVLVDAIHDMKINLTSEFKETGKIFAGQSTRSKIQIVDSSGNAVGVTNNALDVNATISTAGLATEAKQDDIVTAIGSIAAGGDATAANQTTIIGHVDGIETLLGTIDADTSNVSTKIDTLAGAVSGTEMQVDVLTMPTTTVTANQLDVDNLNATDDVVTVTGGAGQTADVKVSLDGEAVTVDLGANNDVTLATLPDTASGDLAAINASTDGIETLLGTIDTDTGNIATSVSTIAGAVATEGSALGSGVLLQGDDGTDRKNINVDATTGDVQVDVTNTVTVDLGANNDVTVTSGSITATQGTATNLKTQAENYQGGTAVGSGNPLQVTLANGSVPSHAVTNAGTFAVQVDGNALTSLQLADDVVYVDDADWTADTSKHTLVGAVTQTVPSANTNGDTTPLITNNLRELRNAALESDLAAASTSHVHKYYTASTPTDGIIWSPAAGKRWYVTHLSINVSAASTVTIEDDKAGGDDPVYKAEFAANSGVVLTFPEVPLFSGEDAADLTVTASAGTVYVTAVGYEL